MFTTRLVVPIENITSIIKALDFYTDEDKSPEENLQDCLADFHFVFVETNENALSFKYSPDDSEDEPAINWETINQIAPYLGSETCIEEYIPYMEDENGREYKGLFVGTINKGVLVRNCYELVKKDGDFTRVFLEEFDRALERQ
jgi:hypothetical protein